MANRPNFLKSCRLLPSNINPEFNKLANSSTDLIPSPGSVAAELIVISSLLLPSVSLILNDENPFISASEIVNVPDDWFPRELKLIDLVVEGMVVIGPSFKKVVATNGFSLEEKTWSILGGWFISSLVVKPIMFNSTLPTLDVFLEIKFFEAAAKSSAFRRWNFMAPAFVDDGDIWNPSPSWGWPIISTWKPLKLILFPVATERPLESLISQLLLNFE